MNLGLWKGTRALVAVALAWWACLGSERSEPPAGVGRDKAGTSALSVTDAASPAAAPSSTPEESGDDASTLQEALAAALQTQEILTAQLRKTNETVRGLRDDVTLLRERLRDLELAQDRRPASDPPGSSVAIRP